MLPATNNLDHTTTCKYLMFLFIHFTTDFSKSEHMQIK